MNKAKRIREARLAAGLSKSALARAIGVSHTAVGLWETGETANLKNDHLYKLEQLTGYSARWLATGKGDKYAVDIELTDLEADLLRRFRLASPAEQQLILRALTNPPK